MNILVCLKQVPSSNIIEFDGTTGLMKRDSNEVKINDIDLHAIETALEIKDNLGGEVVCITMGPLQAKAVIEEAVSLGADRGVILSDKRFVSSDLLTTSNTLKNGIEKLGEFDLVICGKESSDGATGGLSIELGERLGLKTIGNVSKIIEAKMDEIEVMRNADDMEERVKFKLPALISVTEEVNDTRFPNYVDLIRSENMETKILSLDDFKDKDENNYGSKGAKSVIKRVFEDSGEKSVENSINQGVKINEIWNDTSLELGAKLKSKLQEMKFL